VFNVLAKDRATKTLDKVRSAAKVAFAAGAAAAGAFAVKAVSAASDLAETQSKVGQIFGDSARDVLKFSDTAATTLGQSRQQALDAAATFGIFGKSAGLAGTDLTGFSTEMVSLATDLASFNNTSPDEAIVAIGAALRGESEPIRQFGVLLDDATLRARAMKLGLIDTTKTALTPQQKVLAAQAEILAQTSTQQGDFARTADGLANKTRIMKAQFADVTAQVGTKLLPVALKLSTWAQGAIDWMREHGTLLKTLAMVLGPLVGVIAAIVVATKIWTVVQTALNVVMALNPIGLVVLAIIALVAIFVVAYKKSETFRNIVNGVLKAVVAVAKWWWENIVKRYIAGVVAAFQFVVKAGKAVWTGIKMYFGFWKGLLSTVVGWVIGAKDRIVNGFNKVVGFVKGLPKRISSAARGLFDGIKNAFRSAINWLIWKWNNFQLTLGGGSVMGINIPSITLSTPNISYLAAGGIVTRPTLAVLGERGPEAVVPLSRGGGGAQHIIFDFRGVRGNRQLEQFVEDFRAAVRTKPGFRAEVRAA
jgi:hypothetical protein